MLGLYYFIEKVFNKITSKKLKKIFTRFIENILQELHKCPISKHLAIIFVSVVFSKIHAEMDDLDGMLFTCIAAVDVAKSTLQIII